MSGLVDVEYIIVVTAPRYSQIHRIVPTPGWRPDIIDIADPDLVGFTDDLTGIVVCVDVVSEDGTPAGFLIPRAAHCALCNNQRFITVHSWSELAPVTDDSGLSLVIYEPEIDSYSIYVRKPCPACRYVDYQLSRNDSATEAEDQP